MKKVKIMLLSLALIAVVGGALAFKAKFNRTYCTTTPDIAFTCTDGSAILNCTTEPSINYTTTNDPAFPFFCYTLSAGGGVPCDLQECPVTSSLKTDIGQ